MKVKHSLRCRLCLQLHCAAHVMACSGSAHHICSDLIRSRMSLLLLQEGAGRAAAQVPPGAAGVPGAQPACAAPGHAGARRAARSALPAFLQCFVGAGIETSVRIPGCIRYASRPAYANLCVLVMVHSLTARSLATDEVPLMPCHAHATGRTPPAQAAAWRAYIGWERSNPQRLDGPALAARVSLAYEQALMPLYNHPEVHVCLLNSHCYRLQSAPHARRGSPGL